MLLKGSSKSTGKCQCIFEGEEEIGSPNLHRFIRCNRKRLNVDAAVVSDMPIPAPDMPALTYAVHAGLGMELALNGPDQDVHTALGKPEPLWEESRGASWKRQRTAAMPKGRGTCPNS